MRHSRAEFHTFRHNRLSHLKKILRGHRVDAVLTESLFSMDGDSPDFGEMQRLKDEFGFFCIVDEAHAFGVLGDGGRGLAHGPADVAVGTLGKAFGLFGAFILCPAAVREHLIHFGQGFIYTTALPPWHGDMVLAMLDRVAAADEKRDRLRALGDTARQLLGEALPVRGEAHILALGSQRRATEPASGRGPASGRFRGLRGPLPHRASGRCHSARQPDELAHHGARRTPAQRPAPDPGGRMSGAGRIIFVTGTDTDVGKTVLSLLLMHALSGCDAVYLKPVQTGCADPGFGSDPAFIHANLPGGLPGGMSPADCVHSCRPLPKAPLFAGAEVDF